MPGKLNVHCNERDPGNLIANARICNDDLETFPRLLMLFREEARAMQVFVAGNKCGSSRTESSLQFPRVEISGGKLARCLKLTANCRRKCSASGSIARLRIGAK